MPLRIIGVALILCGAFCIAERMIADLEATLKATSALRETLEQIKNMVACYSLPIGQILARLDPSIFEALRYEGGQPSNLLELIEGSEVLDAESREIFFAFAKDFGREYREEEATRCAVFLERMRSREQKLYKEKAKKKKIILTLSLCMALAVIVMLI